MNIGMRLLVVAFIITYSSCVTTEKTQPATDSVGKNEALIRAAETGATDHVRALLKAGADISTRDRNGDTALIRAAVEGYPETVKILLRAGADPNAKNKHGWTALMQASGKRQVEIVQDLLAAGADVNADDGAALIWAVLGGDVRTVRVLVDAGVHVNAKDDVKGATGLMIAAGHDYRRSPDGRVGQWGGNSAIVQILLDAGADIEFKDFSGRTALMWAVQEEGHGEIVDVLLRAGADVNAKDRAGRTALMLTASRNDNPDVIARLIKAGADVNAQDANGETVLIWAADNSKNPEVIATLLKAGADARVEDKAGRTAFVLAEDNPSLRGTDALQQLEEASKTETQVPEDVAIGSLGKLVLPELRIAILAPLSGPVPTFGASMRDGALLAIDEWNERGGVLGMKIVPIVEDGQCTSDPAAKAANKVITQDGVHYIIGEVCSKASIPVSEIATANKVIEISPASTNPAVTVGRNGATKPYIFRACFIDPFQGRVGASFAYDKLGARRAFVMFDPSNNYVRGLAEAFVQTFTLLGGTIAGKQDYVATDTDFSPVLDKIQSSSPDVVYLPDYYTIVNLVTRQAKERGVRIPFLGGDGWDSSDLDRMAADGGYFVNHYSEADRRPILQGFLKRYGEKYKDDSGKAIVPYAFAALAYDAANILLSSIQKAGSDNTDDVRAALETGTFEAVTGNTTFDAHHNPIKGAVILHVHDGRVEFDSYWDPSRVRTLPRRRPPSSGPSTTG